MEGEKARLKEENKQLEESLQLIQSEFESMEDYWQGKIGEERSFYEETVRAGAEQLRQLEQRVAEFAAEGGAGESGGAGASLDTITEDVLEERAAEWEVEIAGLRAAAARTETELAAAAERERQLEARAAACKCGQLAAGRRSLETFWLGVVGVAESSPAPRSLPARPSPPPTRNSTTMVTVEATTQAPPCPDPALAPPSDTALCTAYRAILADIEREVGEAEDGGRGATLEVAAGRTAALHSALASARAACHASQAGLKVGHEAEMWQLESLVQSSQALVSRQARRFLQELDRLAGTDTALAELLHQTDALAATIVQLRRADTNTL